MNKTLKQVLGLDEDTKIRRLVRNETGYRLTILERFSTDGRSSVPDGHFQKVEFLIKESFNKAAFTVSEGYAFDIANPKSKGGVIVFSVDVNAVNNPKDAKTTVEKVKRTLKNKWDSLTNRLFINKKLTDIIVKHNKKTAAQFQNGENPYGVVGFTVGNFFKGRYPAADGSVFDETSTSIEIIGIPQAALLVLATEIAKEFKQETVLVKDYESQRIYLADRTDVDVASAATQLNKE